MKDRIQELEKKLAVWSLVFLVVFIGVGILLGVSGGRFLREWIGFSTRCTILGAFVGGIIGAGGLVAVILTLRNGLLWVVFTFAGVGLLFGARAGYLVGEWAGSTILFTILGAVVGSALGGFGLIAVAMILYELDSQIYEEEVKRSRRERKQYEECYEK